VLRLLRLGRMVQRLVFSLVIAGSMSCAPARPSPKERPSVVTVGRSTGASVDTVSVSTVEVRFDGASALSRAQRLPTVDIDKRTPVPRGDDLDDVLSRDTLAITATYFDFGYIEMEADQPRVVKAKDGTPLSVSFVIREGARYRLRQLLVDERDEHNQPVAALGNENLRSRITLADGDWFSRKLIAEGLADIRRLYADAGYADAEANPETTVDKEARFVDVDVRVHRGVLVRIERIKVLGNVSVAPATIMKNVRVRAGALFSQTRLEETKATLLATGLFKSVDIATTRGSKADLVEIHIEVDER
jgi:outer membrane protein assembly factor BamA